MPAPLSRLLHKNLTVPNRPETDAGNPHYIGPGHAGDAFNRLPWELHLPDDVTAVLWPALPAPVAILPGDAHACLRFHPLDKPVFPATMRPNGRGEAIAHNLRHAAERIAWARENAGRPAAGTTRLTLGVEAHLDFWTRTILPDTDGGRRLSQLTRARIAARFHHQLRNVAALATDDAVLQALLRLCRGTPQPVRLTFLRAFAANDTAGRRIRQWCARFPLGAHALLEESGGTLPRLRAVTGGAPDAVALKPVVDRTRTRPRHLQWRPGNPNQTEFEFEARNGREPGPAARARAAARRTSRDLHRFRLTDRAAPRFNGSFRSNPSSLRETLRVFAHNPGGHLEPAETVALDQAVAKAFRTLIADRPHLGPLPTADAIRTGRRHLQDKARRLLANPTKDDVNTLAGALGRAFALSLEDCLEGDDPPPVNPTPLRVARVAAHLLDGLLRENDDAVRAIRTAFERHDAELWRRVWTGRDRGIRWKRWTAAVERWRDHVAAQVADAQDMTAVDATIRWTSPAPKQPVDGTVVRPLVTIADLVHEGRHMRHCAGTYGGPCLDPDEPSHLYALEGPGPARSTLELREDDGGRVWRVEQHTRSGNHAPPAPHARVAARFADQLNRGEYPYNRRKARTRRKQMGRARDEARRHVDHVLLREILQRAYPGIQPPPPFATF